MHPAPAALLVAQIWPIFSLLAPCVAGASPVSVRAALSPRAAGGRHPADDRRRPPAGGAGDQCRTHRVALAIGNRIRREILREKRAYYGAEIVSTLSRQFELE